MADQVIITKDSSNTNEFININAIAILSNANAMSDCGGCSSLFFAYPASTDPIVT